MILGFLAEGPLHGYLLRERMEQLHAYARTISDGTLYPAISRLVAGGLVRRDTAPGRAGADRRILSLTDAGRDSLEERLRTAAGHDITDGHRFMVILAFLSQLPERSERDAVLRRRLDFLSQPAGFFSEDGRLLPVGDITDPYRRGIIVTARATNDAERAWLTQMLEGTHTEATP